MFRFWLYDGDPTYDFASIAADVSGSWSYAPLLLYMAGKLCITMAFATVYVFTAELFPTTLRHSLLGICSMTGRVGSILSPQTPLLVSQQRTRVATNANSPE